MNEMAARLDELAQSVSDEYQRTAPDNAAVLVSRARRGRVVWTTAVGSAALASGVAIAVGGTAVANGGLRGPAPDTHVTNPGPTLRSLPETAPVHAVAPKATVVSVEKPKVEKADKVKKAKKVAKADKAAKASKAKSAKEGTKGKKNFKHWKKDGKAWNHSDKDCGDKAAHRGDKFGEKSEDWYKEKYKADRGDSGDKGWGDSGGSAGDSAGAPTKEG